ncbi:hypothetical protein J008_01241 [Cryptococcus neoformans]|uniref:Uncharacterized protein n=2 Tax=Cryptococcus neoformans TaxID=5207 RepID=A0A854QI49_CRYNE|nr:hypothetical protein CNAG_03868 [Cryptococcus neoformans var. grubii H99]AUB22904.1 hypothetical protein CKF44_03868 [Cryptococcus neoformans var. grubii]OWT41301.1 hypothetical protein C362_00767 [Cryptococcus neoformans var. grubii Bt1]OWZ34763.1 hypothetical protein C347_01328 [Cryptococcus neoformans var. grubii AD2-60a]OWZ46862.1 hypothetical protein C343_01257 [Cryptococcus neoformans var. grubii C23]OWZ50652.1 hypothetical protein C353_01275 [Cryptococcus neoformans var. grubii AD1-8|eukprot:XP_012047512.1 hypothetical protein CNAG_03868 [Cryptococcus neoformans var. grubii H99]
MFKKRSRPTSVRDKSRIEEAEGSGNEEKVASGSGTPIVEEEEDDDTGRTVEELLMLKKLKKAQSRQGIDLEKLNRGEEKKRKGKKKEDAAEKYGLQPGRGMGRGDGEKEKDEEMEDEAERAKRLVRVNNFTQQTNALDVDKHMMAYIEAELAKRRGQAAATTDESALEDNDPQAELYRIAEKYQFETRKKKADDEGNVTNSLGMLTSIPEVDLGMDNRLKNIEMTEKAKRDMLEQRKQEAAAAAAAAKEAEDPGYAAARFYRPNQKSASDIYANYEKRQTTGAPRQESATDEQVYERFKKRMKR